ALSQIFGLSRSGVSLAARALQKKGLIDYSRGHIAILNRDGLDAASCECYRILSQDLNFRAFRSHPSKSDRVKL
ncbi:MAG: helix-turn-helix domain-containing protein, partial [Blastocatellia bacterium]